MAALGDDVNQRVSNRIVNDFTLSGIGYFNSRLRPNLRLQLKFGSQSLISQMTNPRNEMTQCSVFGAVN